VKKISALLGLVLLASAATHAAGQEASAGARESGGARESAGGRESAGDLPPALNMPEADAASDGDGGSLEPIAETLPPGQTGEDAFGGSILGEPMKLLQACPSYFESSGTWLERGFWYAEMDYLFLNRGWDRKGLRLAFESTNLQQNVNAAVPEGPVLGINELRIRGERPGAEGVGRLTLGRFLFRDASNRDHLMEASWLGGGEWSQEGSLQASTTPGLDVSDFIDRVNRSFDGARTMNFQYDSELNTAELNYKVKARMHRDQMVMQPSGEWVRKATPTRTYSYLAGIRYLNHREELDIGATDIQVQAATTAPREDGFYDIHTENNMLGTQLGGSWEYETARWSLGIFAKGGPMWNRIDLNSRFQVGEENIINSGVTNSEEDDLSFAGEVLLLTKWHLRPNVSIRAGLELFFVDSIALAPHQINFVPGGFEQIAASGDSVYLGTSFGVESYW
jgi:hypothetical protein